MRSHPQATIVIPTFNRSWGLRRALDSALAQQGVDFEVIVVDDASTDDTPEVIADRPAGQLRYLRQESNSGMVASWGKGVDLALGEYLVFLADDDLLLPGFLERRVQALDAHPAALLAFSPYLRQDRNGTALAVSGSMGRSIAHLSGEELLATALRRDWFIGTTLYRTSIVRTLWPTVQADDLVLDLGLNLAIAMRHESGGLFLPEVDFALTAHPDQNSERKKDLVFEQTIALLDRWIAILPPRHPAVRLLRREQANFLVVWGRHVFQTDPREGQARFRQAIAADPRCGWAYRQLAASILQPSRLTGG